ncbi:iron ABC transporter permease [Leptospira sp. 96542]|nr:iron ABC transporter permease [Leptospira sp. 96542]
MKKEITFFLIVGIFFALSIILNSQMGVIRISVYDIFFNPQETLEKTVFYELRLPRILLSLLIGGSLAWSGALSQGLFRNPIVEPGLIGITAGAALFAAIAIVLGSHLSFLNNLFSIVLFSFGGAVAVCLMAFITARTSGKTMINHLLLTGVAINILCLSGIGILSYIANESQLRSLSSWNLGSLAGASWSNVNKFLIIFLMPIFISPFIAKPMNVLLLGEREATHVGLKTEGIKVFLILLICLSVGSSVALVGNIAFVGLFVPHIVRMVIGQDNRTLLFATYILGASILCLADGICRTIVQPTEIPVGVVMSFMGAPVFISLLRRRGNFT